MFPDRQTRSFLDATVLSRLAGVPLFARRPMQGNVSGRHASPHRGASVEFAEYRKYVPGDDLRRLDWRAFGRSDRFYVKEFEADTNLRLCLLIDTSGSMTSEKMSSARQAINRMVFDLLGPMDEFFFMQFASVPDLLQGWTSDRAAIGRALSGASASGGTAMYDAIARAIPIAADGRNQKKAILVISDGNDTNSETTPGQLRAVIRDSEVMVYALGVDGTPVSTFTPPQRRRQPPTTGPRFPVPFPRPGGGGRGGRGDGRGEGRAGRRHP